MILQFGLQTIENMCKCPTDSYDLLINNRPETQANLRHFLLGSLQTVTRSIIDSRKLRSSKEYAKGNLIERGGWSYWRKRKYAFSASAIIDFLSLNGGGGTAARCLEICLGSKAPSTTLLLRDV
ncbi:hypothetical protein MAR_022874 [Mya arenaria]|uniref:Uncharacterized protein n=1 Tax=Mya arenaria TaxID=6604 RepID=A0ABY7DNI6_MYAAR|nr:hypothetical protein MAR_022874 [Mya arenaria]